MNGRIARVRASLKLGQIAVAVVVTLGVVAVSPALGGPSLKSLVKKEVAKQISKATGPQGPPGVNGTNGTNGTARAYATVQPPNVEPCTGGACPFTHAKGIVSVTRNSTGRFCIDAPGIDPDSVAAAATVDFGNTLAPFGNASAQVFSVNSGCPGTLFEVGTFFQPSTSVRDAAGTGTTNVAGNAVASDGVGFTIVIP